MIKIVQVLGNLKDEDTCFLEESSSREYCQSIQIQKEDKNLNRLTSNCPNELANLVEGLLQFNPYLRYSAKECLKSSIFDQIRVPALEKDAPFKIRLNIDKEDAYGSDKDIQTKFTAKNLRKKMMKEISKIKKSK